jgi:hypothetical protein
VKGDLASSQFELGKPYVYVYKRIEIHPQKSTRHVKANGNTRNKCKHMREKSKQ